MPGSRVYAALQSLLERPGEQKGCEGSIARGGKGVMERGKEAKWTVSRVRSLWSEKRNQESQSIGASCLDTTCASQGPF